MAAKETLEEYMTKLMEHPLRQEIEEVRKIIKGANPGISERIKWNAPSYYYKEDMVTFHTRPHHHVHLVFHHPAIVKMSSKFLKLRCCSIKKPFITGISISRKTRSGCKESILLMADCALSQVAIILTCGQL